ncbi:MAG: response regulator transcription factor [Clostridiales bacterium]|jgi:two-component system alkaline phosphatase synthesis response regulator PhoP|nr:response regulator transcription factor [Clostridiales bacterium]
MIYLVEDDLGICELVVYTLTNSGLDAKGFSCAKDFWQAVSERLPNLVLLDIMLPGEDGLSILRRLRASRTTAKLPVMMLTAKGTEYDRVVGLDLGADDYLPKPFGMMELVARVRSLLRRAQAEREKSSYQVGRLFVSVPRHLVTADGAEVTLTLKEFDLLLYLLKNTGIVLTREQLLSVVWNFDFDGETRTVDVHIRTLRGKLGLCGGLIQTVRGVGYKISEEGGDIN